MPPKNQGATNTSEAQKLPFGMTGREPRILAVFLRWVNQSGYSKTHLETLFDDIADVEPIGFCCIPAEDTQREKQKYIDLRIELKW